MSNGTAYGLTTMSKGFNLDGMIGTHNFAGTNPQKSVNQPQLKQLFPPVKPNGMPNVLTPAQMVQTLNSSNDKLSACLKLAPEMAKEAFFGSLVGQAAKKTLGNVAGRTVGGMGLGHAADTGYSLATGQDAPGFTYLGAGLGAGTGIMRNAAPKAFLGARNLMGGKQVVKSLTNNPMARHATTSLAGVGLLGSAREMFTGTNDVLRPQEAAARMKQEAMAQVARELGFNDLSEMQDAGQTLRNFSQSPFSRLFRAKPGQSPMVSNVADL